METTAESDPLPPMEKCNMKAIIGPFQPQLRNCLRACQKQQKRYMELMNESLNSVISYSNTVTQLTYVYSDNWGVLTPFKSIQDETVRKVKEQILSQEATCKEALDRFSECIRLIQMELERMQYIHRELNQLIEEDVLNTVYILDGVSTIQDMERLLSAFLENLRMDLSMRRDIVSSMQKATTDQMGVYASAWKYGPCVDSELQQCYQSLLDNE
ncbi:hypothetical protein WA538_000266, partial [Blastocystis sp. DL]